MANISDYELVFKILIYLRKIVLMIRDYARIDVVYAFQSMVGKPYLYRIRPCNEDDLQALTNNYLWFSKMGDFNDPYEGMCDFVQYNTTKKIDEFLRYAAHSDIAKVFTAKELKNKPELYQAAVRESWADYMGKCKFCCFTTKPDDILMWSHYSNGHKGFMLKFDILEDLEAFAWPFKVKYSSNKPIIDMLSGMIPVVDGILCTKYEGWSYESEVRIIKHSNPENKIPYKPNALKAVYFGCKTEQGTIEKVKEILMEHKNIQFFRCNLSENKYSINFAEI